MGIPVDLDALLAEQASADEFTLIKFRHREWRFRKIMNVPIDLFITTPSSNTEELARVAETLSEAIADDQRADFADLTITIREAWALFEAIVTEQQGVESVGESPAS